MARDKARGREPETVGEPYWMDTALLADAGIPTVVIGGSGAGAHETEEWADVESHVRLAEILVRAAVDFCGAG